MERTRVVLTVASPLPSRAGGFALAYCKGVSSPAAPFTIRTVRSVQKSMRWPAPSSAREYIWSSASCGDDFPHRSRGAMIPSAGASSVSHGSRSPVWSARLLSAVRSGSPLDRERHEAVEDRPPRAPRHNSATAAASAAFRIVLMLSSPQGPCQSLRREPSTHDCPSDL